MRVNKTNAPQYGPTKDWQRAQMRTPETDIILIPELEEAIERGNTGKFGLFWSSKEEEIMNRYYGRVDTALLMVHLPGKTRDQITKKASRMGITGRKG